MTLPSDPAYWELAAGATLVTPDQARTRGNRFPGMSLAAEWFLDCLIGMADPAGYIPRWEPHTFYAGPLSDMLRNEDDSPDWRLTYDRFVAAVLLDLEVQLTLLGYLGDRGLGDGVDLHLALPASDDEPVLWSPPGRWPRVSRPT